MSKITIHNYEAYLLDFAEGQLSQKEAKELQHFLEAHPEIDADIFDFDNLNLQAPEKSFYPKDALKRSHDIPELTEQEERLIAYAEGDLSAQEMAKLEQEASENPRLATELAAYQSVSHLNAGSDSFAGKSTLKKTQSLKRLHVRRITSVAALALILALSVFVWNKLPKDTNYEERIISNNLQEMQATSKEKTDFQQEQIRTTETETSGLNTPSGNSEKIEIPAADKAEIEKLSIKHVPRKQIADLRIESVAIQHAPLPYLQEKFHSERNITYVINPVRHPSKKTFSIDQIDSFDDAVKVIDKNINPIKKARRFKEELLAINSINLF